MNQSSIADRNKSATKKPTQYIVKLPARSVKLLKIGTVVDVQKKIPSLALSPSPSSPSLSSAVAAAAAISTASASLSFPSDTARTAVSAVDLSIKYRTILEELLRLKIDLVTKNISAAIKEVIVSDIAKTTSDDWLLVIFKALERTLDALDVGLIYSNDSYLAAISRLLYRLIDTSKLLELVENRSETKDFEQYFTQKMSKVLSQVSMEAVYKRAQELFESKRRSSYAQILELLATSLTEWPATPENALSPQKLSLWFEHVLPSEFDADADIQQNAINAVEMVMPLLMVSKHQSHPDWPKHRNNVITKYVKEISVLFQKNSPQWYRTWCHCVQVLDIEIPRSATTLNAFLGIVEPALRSVIPMRRAEGYLCWRVLLGVLVRHNRLNSEKRLKLACTPLKSLQAKTAEIASNKFLAWWYVLCNVVDNSAGYNSMVFEPFLQFCFGPLAAEPNIRSEIIDTTAQVKRFPDVSLMAIATFVRILGDPSPQTSEIFKKYALDQMDRTICTEKQFQHPLAQLIINACGEATFMLTNLGDDSNNNVNCCSLASQLWRNLLVHVNRVQSHEHMILMLDNISQLLVASAKAQNDERKEKTINLVKIIVVMLIENAIAYEVNVDGPAALADSKSHEILLRLMEIVSMLPIAQSNGLLVPSLVIPPTVSAQFVQRRTQILHSKFLSKGDEQFEDDALTSPVVGYNFRVWMRWAVAIQSWWHINSATVQILKEKSLNSFIDSIVECLLWPLTALIGNKESLLYAKSLSEMGQLISAVIGKKSFCQRSAKLFQRAITLLQHCAHINQVVTVLFDFMNYDYKGLPDAPVDVLNLCVAIIDSGKKVSFQDLNPIALAIVDYYKAIKKPQRAIIETKLREVMTSIEKTKSEMRVDPKLVSAFHELIENGRSDAPIETLVTPKSTKRAATAVEVSCSASGSGKTRKVDSADGKYVVVEKVWSLKPNRLTDHQMEKLKERRHDIPALYNNLSQSQDSVSLKEWTPKALVTTARATKMISETEADDTVSVVSKSNEKDDVKAQDENVASNNTEQKISSGENGSDAPKEASVSEPYIPKKLEFSDDMVDESEEKKKRIERELSRIHIDAVIDAVPFADGMARRTRSSRSLDERAPKRKTRNDTPSSAVKTTSKSFRTSIQAKAKKQIDSAASIATDSSEGDALVQRPQTPQSDLPTVQKKRKLRTISIEIRLPEVPIEEMAPNIEENVATDSNINTTEATKKDNDPSVAMHTIENETQVDKDEVNSEQMLPSPTVDDNQETELMTDDNNGNDGAAKPLDDAPAMDDGMIEDLSSSPVVEGRNLLGKSFMSPLVFHTSTVGTGNNLNESILTSPKIDDKKNTEFLNDTLNISPIVPETIAESDVMMPCSVVIECTTATISPKSSDNAVRTLCTNVDATIPYDPAHRINESSCQATPHTKAFRSSQCSTPLHLNQSPVSSKFKPQVMGRGAQLLKMINSNKNNNQQSKLCALPTTMTMSAGNESATVLVSTTASPTINKLQTAPIYGANLATPESANDAAKSDKTELLTFSRALPSPYESPRFSILKRKASKDAEDDSIHSPAHKRKRVSFNFPLTETVEFLTEEEMAPIVVPTNSALSSIVAHREIDASSIRSPANAKYKMKLKKHIDSAKDCSQVNNSNVADEPSTPPTSIVIGANKLFRGTNEDEVSVEYIKEYLEMNISSHREKQKKSAKESDVTTATNAVTATSANDGGAANSSSVIETVSSKADVADSSPLSPPSIAMSLFSENEIFQHIFLKYDISEIFNKYEECKRQPIDTQTARFFSRKLSAFMANDASAKAAVLDELAERHSKAFLDYAVTENLCSTICDRLMTSSKDSIVDFVGEKINCDQNFATSILSRLNARSLHKRILSASSPDEKHQLLIDIIAQADPNNASEHEAITALLSKIFEKFNFTLAQFHEFTTMHILKTIQSRKGDASN